MSEDTNRTLAEARQRLPEGLFEHLETIAGPLSVERDELGTWLTSAKLQERIWVPAPELSQAQAPQIQGAAPLPCGTTELLQSRALATQDISDQGLIRWRSKYPIGSVVVHVTFIQGPTVRWTRNDPRFPPILQAISQACARIGALVRNDGQPWPKPTLYMALRRRGIVTGPSDNLVDWSKLAPTLKAFLADEGLFLGAVNDESRGADYRQAYYDHERRLLSSHRTDWCINIFVAPGTARAYATARHDEGFVHLFENSMSRSLEDTALHEMLHCFGAGDEYADVGCFQGPWGLYRVDNSNCGTPEGELNCMMGNFGNAKFTGRDRLCAKTVQQMALIPHASGGLLPLQDAVQHGYQLSDAQLRSVEGVYLLSDVIRAGGQVQVSVTGQAKMSGMYRAHGPEGDTGVAGDAEHLMPGLAVGCIIARWCSVGGTLTSPWFYVGKGGSYQAPWDAYLQVNVNDKKGWFQDNSGAMSVTLRTRLPDNLGQTWVERLGHPRAGKLYASTFHFAAAHEGTARAG